MHYALVSFRTGKVQVIKQLSAELTSDQIEVQSIFFQCSVKNLTRELYHLSLYASKIQGCPL